MEVKENKYFSCVIMGWDITIDVISRLAIFGAKAEKDIQDSELLKTISDGYFIGKIVSCVDGWDDTAVLAFDSMLLTEMRQMAYRRIELFKSAWGLEIEEEPRLFHLLLEDNY